MVMRAIELPLIYKRFHDKCILVIRHASELLFRKLNQVELVMFFAVQLQLLLYVLVQKSQFCYVHSFASLAVSSK